MITTKKKIHSLSPPSGMGKQNTDREGFRRAQRLAYEAAVTIGKELREGWTEARAAALMGTYLRDCGVKAFFHEPYAWFGERTRFDGIARLKYSQFNPTNRRLNEGDAVILDVAPILDGCVGDIGYSLSLGANPRLDRAKKFLRELRAVLPSLADAHFTAGSGLWNETDRRITDAGYDNIHQIYPFHVLGHRVARVPFSDWALRTPLRFSLHSIWQILSNGFLTELLNAEHKSSLAGLWAIEPHIGWEGGGAKFEEILVIDPKGSYWLDNEVPHA